MKSSTDQGPSQIIRIARQGDQCVLEMDAALSRLNGDHELLAEQTKLFLEYCPELVLDLARAVTSEEVDAIRIAAHSLKGVLADFTSKSPFETARLIEIEASEGDLSGINSLLERLEEEIEMLVLELQPYSAVGYWEQAEGLS
jgi:two-component system, sensor histidine kinase and response regulator